MGPSPRAARRAISRRLVTIRRVGHCGNFAPGSRDLQCSGPIVFRAHRIAPASASTGQTRAPAERVRVRAGGGKGTHRSGPDPGRRLAPAHGLVRSPGCAPTNDMLVAGCASKGSICQGRKEGRFNEVPDPCGGDGPAGCYAWDRQRLYLTQCYQMWRGSCDACGVCLGDGSSCAGCDGVSNSGKVIDACGICGGDGCSCRTTCDGT